MLSDPPSFNPHLCSTYHAPLAVVGDGDTSVNTTDTLCFNWNSHLNRGERDTNTHVTFVCVCV